MKEFRQTNTENFQERTTVENIIYVAFRDKVKKKNLCEHSQVEWEWKNTKNRIFFSLLC